MGGLIDQISDKDKQRVENVAKALFENHTHVELCDPREIVYTEEHVKKIMGVAIREYSNHLLDQVYETIKHGDEEHMKWLKDKCEELRNNL